MRIENGASGRGERVAKPDLQAVLLHYGLDAPHSGNYTCIVHEETRASLSVNLEEQVVQCFSCGFAGDAFNIIMSRESVDFAGATEFARATGFGEAPQQKREEVSVLGRRRSTGRTDRGGRSGWRRPW